MDSSQRSSTHAALEIIIGMDQADAESLDRQTLSLRNELRRLDVDDVSRPVQAAPDGTRGVDLAVVGALAVQVIPAVENIRAIVDTVRQWVGRRRERTAAITMDGDTLTVSGVSEHDMSRLVDLFVERHGKGRQ